MAHDAFTDRLSDYIDDEVGAEERRLIDAHLESCADCRTVLEGLRQVVAHAAALEDTPPAGDLWPGIAARAAIDRPRAGGLVLFRRLVSARRFSFTLPQLAAATIAVMLLSGGVVWMARSGDPRADFEPLSAEVARTPALTPAAAGDTPYDAAVTDLEGALQAGRTHLDPATVRILEENLASIDRAIDQSRRALAADPANLYLNRHLAAARQRKLSLLRRASALATAGG
jgi:anti-sigma factor RsiW